MHPVLAVALGETDDVVVRFPIAAGAALDGAAVDRHAASATTRASTCSRSGAAGRYLYRPRGRMASLQAGDEVLATGPWEGRATLAEQCGYRFVEDDDTGEVELVPLASVGRRLRAPHAHSATMTAITPTATAPT